MSTQVRWRRDDATDTYVGPHWDNDHVPFVASASTITAAAGVDAASSSIISATAEAACVPDAATDSMARTSRPRFTPRGIANCHNAQRPEAVVYTSAT
jgi:hypothetical protein